MIDISGVDLREFVKRVYDLSRPQGLGFMHFTPVPLSDAEVDEILGRSQASGRYAFIMDYVKGRACKMTAWREDGKVLIEDDWFDHSPDQLTALLEPFGIKLSEPAAAVGGE